MKARWERPQIVVVDQASEAWGDCVGGSTPTDTTCENGQNTGFPHCCANGGSAYAVCGCQAGDSPED